MRTVTAIEADISTTLRKLKDLRAERGAALIASCPRKIGDVIKVKRWARGKGEHVIEMVVREFDTRYSSSDHHVLKCSPRKKDGEWSRHVYSVWPDSIVEEA
jgi:hypothetical protein